MPISLPTIKVHLRQQHQNIRTTNRIAKKEKLGVEALPIQESKTQDCFFAHNKGSRNDILRPHWNISNYLES